jgi:hypothetical protein
MPDYTIKPAPYSFNCPIYGDSVKKGENCVDEEGALFCMRILEERNLVPVKKTPSACGHSPSKGGENPGRNGNPFGRGSVRWENLMMRLELETIAENPESKAAKKIIAKYRRKMKAREERYLSAQN